MIVRVVVEQLLFLRRVYDHQPITCTDNNISGSRDPQVRAPSGYRRCSVDAFFSFDLITDYDALLI